jgi:N-acetylglucosaminyldiphosphoundecaprenol N-acetyl-beta-D-mannosaminyltransferase
MGSPKQELWLAKNIEAINACFCICVGGALDVVSGKAKRAPVVLRKIGLEFLYRLILQPKRFRRQLALPKFALMVLKEKLVSIINNALR